MAAILWTEALSVKIRSIDDQHKKLIDMINDFYDNISKHSNNELIIKLVNGMKSYTIMHFNQEERYMVQYKYPYYEQHKKEHEQFIAKVNALEEKLKQGKIIVSFEITSFLKDWLKQHIMKTDKQYGDFFIKHGIV
ncbi:MAG: hemerythrin family protein [Bacteroidales bacterium]|nr:hemerythrin family protein [Bacteroidales bacterium]